MGSSKRQWKNVNRHGPVPVHCPTLGPCWLWQGYVDSKGYGRTILNGKSIRLHNAVYVELVGPRPIGLEPDHLCRVKACCNPRHIEFVSHQVNVQRGDARAMRLAITHCPAGHKYTKENTQKKLLKNGAINRVCRACARQYHVRKRAE